MIVVNWKLEGLIDPKNTAMPFKSKLQVTHVGSFKFDTSHL